MRVLCIYRVRLSHPSVPAGVCARADWPVDKLSGLEEWRDMRTPQNPVHGRWCAHMSHLSADGLMMALDVYAGT